MWDTFRDTLNNRKNNKSIRENKPTPSQPGNKPLIRKNWEWSKFILFFNPETNWRQLNHTKKLCYTSHVMFMSIHWRTQIVFWHGLLKLLHSRLGRLLFHFHSQNVYLCKRVDVHRGRWSLGLILNIIFLVKATTKNTRLALAHHHKSSFLFLYIIILLIFYPVMCILCTYPHICDMVKCPRIHVRGEALPIFHVFILNKELS